MRIFAGLLLYCIGGIGLHAQNLVPNSSFEDYEICPDSPGQISRAEGWSSFQWTPDYLNSCNTNGYCDVPSNAFGFQSAASGNSYIGVLTFDEGTQDLREYAGAELVTPLQIGVPVFISLKVAPGGFGWYVAQRFRYTSNRIGVLFTTAPYSGTEGPVPNSSAIDLGQTLTDTLGWTTISGWFTPDSSYSFIVLGNFYDDMHTSRSVIDDEGPYAGAYVFIDDVYVSEHPMSTEDIQAGGQDRLSVFPSCFADHVTIESSQGNGSYELMDISGRTILYGTFSAAGTDYSIPTQAWPTGPCLLRVTTPGHRSLTARLFHIQP